MRKPLVTFTTKGLYCRQADVYIDPWRSVDAALITHAHSDHARSGHRLYIAHHHTVPVLRLRLGTGINAEGVEYGQVISRNGVNITFFPAGHIIGSAQVRLEYQGEIWVISGDYKLNNDGLSTPFEPVRCHHFVSESTFGLPVFRWEPSDIVFGRMNEWWAANSREGRNTVMFGYSLGKAQRILHAADANIGEIFVHGSIDNTNQVFRHMGFNLHETRLGTELDKKTTGALVIAPPSASDTAWLRRFEPYVTGVASGWMNLRGARRRGAIDRGFVISDHADWTELNIAIKESGAEHVYITHGYTSVFTRWLQENGIDAREVSTQYEGELGEINETKALTTEPNT